MMVGKIRLRVIHVSGDQELAVISTGRLHRSIYYHKRPSNTRQINNQAELFYSFA
jgi:hypothetical protein